MAVVQWLIKLASTLTLAWIVGYIVIIVAYLLVLGMVVIFNVLRNIKGRLFNEDY